MSDIEDLLKDAFAAKAATVADDGIPRPVPPPRRSFPVPWLAPVAVAVCLVVVASGIMLAVRGRTDRPPPAGPYALPTTAPIDRVWPGAVHRVPAEGPGGVAFTPADVVGDQVVGKGEQETILRYDLTRRSFGVLATVNAYTTNLVAGDGHAVWWSAGALWSVPLTGGQPLRLATLEPSPASLTGLGVADGMVVWSTVDAPVRRVPLSGGAVGEVPGSTGYVLMEWPWAGKGRDELLDLRDGARSTAPLPPGRTVWFGCGPEWCADLREAWRRDGTATRPFPGRPSARLWGWHVVHLIQPDPDGEAGSALYDLASGRAGHIVLGRGPKGGLPSLVLGDRATYYQEGDTVTVIDMDALR
ncbi:hypothetical protein [Herbidospora cretacea]|uniref:hypothetical protein n=1 Tax=Herbidospora cretacea TaxID=28444 RepID=UPI0004C42CA5|nr:hypothetical protein [Herbidospora cretacea]